MWFTEYLKSILLRTTAQKKYFFQNIPTIDNAVEEGSPSVLMPIQLLSHLHLTYTAGGSAYSLSSNAVIEHTGLA